MLGELERLERELAKLSSDERWLKEKLINGFAGLVSAEVCGERLRALGEALEAVRGDDDHEETGDEERGLPGGAALEGARMRNLVRVLEDRARFREESLRSGTVEKALGVGRERLRQMREAGRILGFVQGERRPTLYPYSRSGTIPGFLYAKGRGKQ